MKLTLALLASLLTLSAQAAVFKLDCTFTDPEVKDHILIELHSDQRGTFYYKAESDEATAATSADKLDLLRVTSDRDDTAKWRVKTSDVGLYFLMPANFVMKPADSFKASLLTKIDELNLSNEQEMKCSSKN